MGYRVPSSLNHNRGRVNINMPGHVCQAVKCEEKTHTQAHTQAHTHTHTNTHTQEIMSAKSVHPITPRSYLVWGTWREKCVLPVSGFLHGTQRAQITSVSGNNNNRPAVSHQADMPQGCIQCPQWKMGTFTTTVCALQLFLTTLVLCYTKRQKKTLLHCYKMCLVISRCVLSHILWYNDFQTRI